MSLHFTYCLALLVSVGGCNAQLRGGSGAPQPASGPATLGPSQRGRATPASRAVAEVRRVCRYGGITAGWIAIDYEASNECPSTGPEGERYTGALVVYYRDLARDAELVVCVDQRVPRDWTRQPLPDTALVEGQCRSSLPDQGGTERVKLIRRVR